MNNLFTLHLGDCLESLRGMADNSVHAVICDPPYGLSQHTPDQVLECLRAWLAGEVYAPKGKGFMGKSWDAWVPGPEVWREALRVLKPGGHVLAFAGTRSMDLMSMAIRLAGFELRDAVGYAHDGGGAPLMAWSFGSGFPKSMDVSKQLDKAAGADREVVGLKRYADGQTYKGGELAARSGGGIMGESAARGPSVETAPATEAARQWAGFGTALKPAWEPIILARKPLAPGHTVAANVLAHGTGGLNIDGCRVSAEGEENPSIARREAAGRSGKTGMDMHSANRVKQGLPAFNRDIAGYVQGNPGEAMGRWPANLILSYNEDEFELCSNVTSEQRKQLLLWIYENT